MFRVKSNQATAAAALSFLNFAVLLLLPWDEPTAGRLSQAG